MIRLKVIYNIDNITSVQNKNMPIYFAVIDTNQQTLTNSPYPYYLWVNAAMVVYSDEVSFIEDTKITFGNNGTSTRVIKNPDKKQLKTLLRLIEKYSLGTLNKYIDIILDKIVE